MDLQTKICGFAVRSCRQLPELNARLHELYHERSGARLAWLDREEENKTFGIAFQTVPEDDTGVFHILEHSVLCGSEKFPIKDPFVELMKSSLQTFLNAMTFPDKTYYPVSSRNTRDFLNLMRVYMDAVLHPQIYSRPEIFEQEGWHYEFGPDGEVSYQGVVLNEMKGNFSSPDTLMRNELNRQLFPDTGYRYVYGGDPAYIPDLTYEQFLDCHRRFYHPSNSYILLDGKVDLEQVLSILDGEYLSAYDREDRVPAVPMQPAIQAAPVRIRYESAPDEPVEGRSRLAWGYVLGDYTCRRETLAFQVLADALCGSNDAPLKRSVLSAGLAQDVRIRVLDGVLQPYVTLEVISMNEDRVDEIRPVVTGEIARLSREGLDRGQLAATLANMEFQMRERDYGSMPQGLGLSFAVLENWLYGGDPAAGLEVGALFADLNEKLEEGYFEALLERVILQSAHTCEVLLVPSSEVGQERRGQEAARLQKERDAWTDEQKKILLDRQEKRLAWQSAQDTAEAAATLPKLKLSDLSAQPEDIPTEVSELDGLPLLYHPIAAGGVDYVNLYFDVGDLDKERLAALSLLCGLLGSLNTDRHSTTELQQLERLNLGSLRFSVEPYSRENQPERCRVFLCASYSAVEGKLAEGTALAAEILTGTRFDNGQKIHELLRQMVTRMERGIVSNGSSFAVTRVSAGFSTEAAVREYTGGIAWYQWIKKLEKDFENRADGLQKDLNALLSLTVTTGRLTVSVTGQDKNAAAVLKNALLNKLPVTPRTEQLCTVAPWGVKREGIIVPADVSFAAMGGSLLRCGAPYNGVIPVLGKVMRLAYLWNAIRVQGGAYGTGFSVGETGNACYYSFRDPNAARSLNCYRQAADVIRQLPDTVPELTDFIIGTVADDEPLLLPKGQGKLADSLYWQGVSFEDRCRRRSELLSTRPEDLAVLAGPLERLAETAGICAIGPQRQIEACGAELDEVFPL